MSVFFAVIFISGYFSLEFLIFVLPVIWFYSFFDAINYNNLPYEKKILVEDKIFLFDGDLGYILNRYRTIFGFLLLFLGAYTVFRNIVMPFVWQFSNPYLSHVIDSIPTVLISVLIILIGAALIKKGSKDSEIKDMRDTEYTDFDNNKQ